jgi:ABC-type dipeptide/oligopeptide/nickel transport system permease component
MQCCCLTKPNVLASTLQRQLVLVGRILPEFMNVLVVVALFVVFCAWFATTVFVGYERWHYFASISQACWTELVLLTRSNFLDVMIHAYARVSTTQYRDNITKH